MTYNNIHNTVLRFEYISNYKIHVLRAGFEPKDFSTILLLYNLTELLWSVHVQNENKSWTTPVTG